MEAKQTAAEEVNEKVRAAATLLGEAGSLLGSMEPKQAWYDCNKLYHDAHAWLDRWEEP